MIILRSAEFWWKLFNEIHHYLEKITWFEVKLKIFQLQSSITQRNKKKIKVLQVLMVDSYCIFHAENDAVGRFSLSPHIVEFWFLCTIKWNINQHSIRVFEYPFDYIEIRAQRYEVIAKNGGRHRSQREKYSKNQPSELGRIFIFFFFALRCVINGQMQMKTFSWR